MQNEALIGTLPPRTIEKKREKHGAIQHSVLPPLPTGRDRVPIPLLLPITPSIITPTVPLAPDTAATLITSTHIPDLRPPTPSITVKGHLAIDPNRPLPLTKTQAVRLALKPPTMAVAPTHGSPMRNDKADAHHSGRRLSSSRTSVVIPQMRLPAKLKQSLLSPCGPSTTIIPSMSNMPHLSLNRCTLPIAPVPNPGVRFRNDIFMQDPANSVPESPVYHPQMNGKPPPVIRYPDAQPTYPTQQMEGMVVGQPLSRHDSSSSGTDRRYNGDWDRNAQRKAGAPVRVSTVTGVGGRKYAPSETMAAERERQHSNRVRGSLPAMA